MKLTSENTDKSVFHKSDRNGMNFSDSSYFVTNQV